MKHINAGVNIDKIPILYWLKMAQHAIYCLKSLWTLQGRCWHMYVDLIQIYIIKWAAHLPQPEWVLY